MADHSSLPSSANSDTGNCHSKELVDKDFGLERFVCKEHDFYLSCLNSIDPTAPQEKCATTTSQIQEPQRFFSLALWESGFDRPASEAQTFGLRIDLTSGKTPTVQNSTTVVFAECCEPLRPLFLGTQDAYTNALMWGCMKGERLSGPLEGLSLLTRSVVDNDGKPTESRVVREISAKIPIKCVSSLDPRSAHPKFLHVVFVLDDAQVPGSKDFALQRRSYKEESGSTTLLFERPPTGEELAALRLAEAESKCIAWAGFSSYRVLWYHVTSTLRKGFGHTASTRRCKLSEL